MKLRWTILLLIVNALLLWGVIEQLATPPAERSFNAAVRSFLPLTRGDWTGVGVHNTSGGWSVERDRWGHWWLKSPYEWPAKTGLVSRMNGALSTLEIDSAFAVSELGRVGQSLRSYGLDNPRCVLEVSNGARTLSYKIGNTTPLGNKMYVLSADEKEVWVVDAALSEYLAYTPVALRQEGFFPFSVIELESLEVEQNGETSRYERKQGTNFWQLKLPAAPLALSPGSWERWLLNLSQVTPVEKSAADESVLKKVFCRLTFQTLYGRHTLIVGDFDPAGLKRAAQWEGSHESLWLPVENLSILKLENFLEARPLPFDASQISSLDWSSAQKTLSLRRLEGGAWVIASEKNAPADPEAVRALLDDLCRREGVPHLDKARSKAEASSAAEKAMEKLRVQTPEQTTEVVVLRQPDAVTLLRAATGVAYELKSWPLSSSAESLADKRLFASLSGAPTSLIFRVLGAGARQSTYDERSAQLQAFAALLKNSPKAQRLLEAAPATPPGYQLEFVAKDEHTLLDLWAQNGVWTARLAGKVFEPEGDLAAFLETLTTL